MSQFRFRGPDASEIAAGDWLRIWSALYPANDEPEYQVLISKHNSFSSADFEDIGRWKDNARTPGKWKPNVASVAYRIWMQIAADLPKCPEANGVADFLEDWSNRSYKDEYATGAKEKRFGLSRASTLLHFLSGGRYPIFDSRVRNAMRGLLNSRVPYTVPWYVDSLRPHISEIAALCGTNDLRQVDRALFAYGRSLSS